MNVLFFFILGLVILEFRQGVVVGGGGTVHPSGFVVSLVEFVVGDGLATGSDHRDRVWGV